MNKKKVLFISSASIHTKRFVDMVQDEFDVYLLTNKKDVFKDSKIVNIYLWKTNGLSNIFFTYKILKEIKPSLISIQQIGLLSFFYLVLLGKKYKTLITSWGSDVMIFPYQNIINMFFTKYALKRATYISSIDSIGMISVLKCLSGFKKDIIPINFGISRYVEFENNFNKKDNIVYSPRGHKDIYNVEKIIYSFANFVKNNNNWKLLIAGAEDDINTPRYIKLIKDLKIEDNVQFLGYLTQDKNADIYKKSKIVVSIPFSDGKSISVMEAISSNCLVIVSDILANHELVKNNINGCIIDHKKQFDLNCWKNIDIETMTKYNYALSQEFKYEKAKEEFVNLLKGLLNDNNNR